jgi:hypothetical protein
MQEQYVAAAKGKEGEMQDLKDRWGFNVMQLCEEKGLEVLACNFMRVGGTVESSMVNAGLMAQAVVDKVCSSAEFGCGCLLTKDVGHWKIDSG